MGYNQHNAGLHFVRYSSREDLSVYDRIVQRQRNEERIKLAYEAMKKKKLAQADAQKALRLGADPSFLDGSIVKKMQ